LNGDYTNAVHGLSGLKGKLQNEAYNKNLYISSDGTGVPEEKIIFYERCNFLKNGVAYFASSCGFGASFDGSGANVRKTFSSQSMNLRTNKLERLFSVCEKKQEPTLTVDNLKGALLW
jgi:hypothetical protein